MIGDPADREQVPASFEGAQVLATSSTVICKIQHETDGEAEVEVFLDGAHGGLILVHDGTMSLPSGALQVTDAGQEQRQQAQVPPGRHRVRVWADEVPDPTLLRVTLDAL